MRCALGGELSHHHAPLAYIGLVVMAAINAPGLDDVERQAVLADTEAYVTLLLADSGLPTGK